MIHLFPPTVFHIFDKLTFFPDSQIYTNITRTILLLQIDMANLLGSLSVLCLVFFSVFWKFSG